MIVTHVGLSRGIVRGSFWPSGQGFELPKQSDPNDKQLPPAPSHRTEPPTARRATSVRTPRLKLFTCDCAKRKPQTKPKGNRNISELLNGKCCRPFGGVRATGPVQSDSSQSKRSGDDPAGPPHTAGLLPKVGSLAGCWARWAGGGAEGVQVEGLTFASSVVLGGPASPRSERVPVPAPPGGRFPGTAASLLPSVPHCARHRDAVECLSLPLEGAGRPHGPPPALDPSPALGRWDTDSQALPVSPDSTHTRGIGSPLPSPGPSEPPAPTHSSSQCATDQAPEAAAGNGGAESPGPGELDGDTGNEKTGSALPEVSDRSEGKRRRKRGRGLRSVGRGGVTAGTWRGEGRR